MYFCPYFEKLINMNRSAFLKRLLLIGISGSSVPSLLASSEKTKENQSIEKTDETGPFAFLTKPYLQLPLDGVMTVGWITNRNCYSWVEFGEDNSCSQQASTTVDGLSQAYNRIHKIRLEELKPNTRYAYKVCSKEIVQFNPYNVVYGETLESPVYHFTTPSTTTNEVSLLILNDIHDRPESIPHLLELNKNDPYDFVCLNGDIVNYLESESQLITNVIHPCTESFASEKPVVYVRGNHETRGLFARHLYEYLDTGENPYYSFFVGPAFFIVPDTGEDKQDNHKEYFGLVSFADYRKKQTIWLERQLKSKAAKKAAFRVVLLHIPPYHSDEGYGTRQCRELFVPLFKKYKVDLVIAGHTHKYGIYDPSSDHPFPMIIGGGPQDGKRTLIKLHVTRKNMDVTLINDSGEIFSKHCKLA
jgi:predicted phosphodiesterase